MTEKIRVWDAPTRVLHWLLALCFVGTFLSRDSERFRDIHILFGYTLLGLIGFRLLWGALGIVTPASAPLPSACQRYGPTSVHC